ncbi:MAG: trehalose-phosphatase [Dehalococcoidia bacterium]
MLRQILARRPSGLFLDIDGTISHIAPTPADAVVSPRARDALARVRDKVDRLTFISGRGPRSAAEMVGLLGANVAYVGNHGMSLLIGGRSVTPAEAVPFIERVQEVVQELSSLLDAPGVLFEERGPLLTIHYRLAEDPEQAREIILRQVEKSGAAGGMELSEGRKIVELRPPLGITKGTAIENLAREWELGSAVMMGDDITDITAFDALRRLREYDDLETASVAVLSGEADPAVADAADYTVEGVASVEKLLEELSGE